MQAVEAEVRQQLTRPQAEVDAQVAAAQAEWDLAQSRDTFDHKLVSLSTNQMRFDMGGIRLPRGIAVLQPQPVVQFHQQAKGCLYLYKVANVSSGSNCIRCKTVP